MQKAASVDEAKSIRDKIIALKTYARQTKNVEMYAWLSEIGIRAKRRIGELSRNLPEIPVEKRHGKNHVPAVGHDFRGKRESLRSAGISKSVANRCEEVSRISEELFESFIAEKKKKGQQLTDSDLEKAVGKKARREKQVEDVKNTMLPEGKYHVIVVDPPWGYSLRPGDASHRAANPYPSMSIEEIMNYPEVIDHSHDNCILWLWTTNAFMCEAHRVAENWGFEVKTILTWAKDKIGLGDWLRGQTEHALMCVKGKPVIDLKNQSTIIFGPLREHSRKPDEFYAMVESLCLGDRRLELFSRTERSGWDVCGSEVGKFDGK